MYGTVAYCVEPLRRPCYTRSCSGVEYCLAMVIPPPPPRSRAEPPQQAKLQDKGGALGEAQERYNKLSELHKAKQDAYDRLAALAARHKQQARFGFRVP